MKQLLFVLFIAIVYLVGCTPAGAPTGVDIPADNGTSVITSSPTHEPVPEPEPIEIRIQFAGDVLLHCGPINSSNIGTDIYDFRPSLRYIAPFIDGDLNIVNMETPVDVLGGNQDLTTFPRFNAPFEILEALDYAGFNLLIAANNHTFDRGFDGMIATIENFNRVGLAHTGAYIDQDAFNTPKIIDVSGIKIGVIAYTDSFNGLEVLLTEEQLQFASRRFRSYTTDDVPYMAQEIDRLREAGAELIIVSLHWGAEYINAPTAIERQIAEKLSEAGADVIMGHHAHVIQPVEWHYRSDGTRSLIIYDLGNFLADQTRLPWYEPRTQYSMLVSLNAIKQPDGTIELTSAEVLPTLIMRDRAGTTLGGVNNVSILPLFNGELPEFVEIADMRAWGRRAYEHVVYIVGEEWIRQ